MAERGTGGEDSAETGREVLGRNEIATAPTSAQAISAAKPDA